MWLNVQSYDEPHRIKFNVDDGKCWRAFFGKSSKEANKFKFESIQPERLLYFATDAKCVRDLEMKIESKLRDKLGDWRPRHMTKISRYASSALRQVLAGMERAVMSTASSNVLAAQKEPDELEQLQNTYRISGFPINVPYTNMNGILEAVHATQVHAVPTSDVEFALAVHICPYPNTIMSVWVYVASLVRKS